MNNDQFRKLMLANSGKKSDAENGSSAKSSAGSGSLGSRQRASIPMTPRSVANNPDFARQLAERDQAGKLGKKFRSSAPRGSQLASGYTDRTKAREDEDEDDRVSRIKALEESLKKEDIDQATFERLRSQIAGGDLSSTHLVKGLDFKLLERIKRGEDVSKDRPDDGPESDGENVDDELDNLEQQDVKAVAREKTAKKGQLATTTLAPGKKRTRDQILAELKASREAAAKAKAESALGNRFKKIGATQKAGSRIERDSKGREVLIVVDEDGHEKRKVRKIQPGTEDETKFLHVPDENAKPLGMEVPEHYRKMQEEAVEDEEIEDIFADAGDDYDPLAGLGTDSDEDEEPEEQGEEGEVAERAAEASAAMPPPPKPSSVPPRNYFKDSKTSLASSEERKAPTMSDPAIQTALKKAAAMKPVADDADDDEEARVRQERRRRMLQNADRDAEDMDMGFGTSRFEDEEDFEEKKVKLSKWGDEGDEGEEGRGGKSKRKRGPKKRKGDGNSAADVLRVLERRKAESG